MATAKTIGICRLCGLQRELSFEHAPPKSTGNTQPIQVSTLQDTFRRRRSDKRFPRGLGQESLCINCNRKMGDWYVGAYAEWVAQAEQVLFERSGGGDHIPFGIQPLNVLKQVVVMALAMVAEADVDKHRDLREFVLDRSSKQMPIEYGVYSYLNIASQPRYEGLAKILDLVTGELVQVIAEIALPPLGHCVAGRYSLSPTDRSIFPLRAVSERSLCPIDWFTYFDIDEYAVVPLRLPRLATFTYFSLDYRGEEEMLRVTRNTIVDLLCGRYNLF